MFYSGMCRSRGDAFGNNHRGFGHHGFGHHGFGRFGAERWAGAFGRGGGRMFGQGDLRLVLLALIGKKPSHGYELIRSIEEKFGGAYAPSPGAVYPTLTLLEEQDLIRSESAEGGKKLYAITPTGEAHLKENEAAVNGVMQRMDLAASALGARATPDSVREAVHTLRQALGMHRGGWTSEEEKRVARLIERAAKDIVGGMPDG
jgi:DNA-binding PadR family transcriptional regulator